MNEREKMTAGLNYNPANEELFKDRIHAKTLCYNYNKLEPSNFAARKKLLKELLGKTKENFHIEPNFFCDYGYNIELGENFYSNHNLVILDCAKVTIGNNVWIGPNCGIYTATHPTNSKERISGIEFAKPISIGDNVWLGGNVCIMPGITIGTNTVIGGGSVVTKDIPANVIAAGNPCKVIKETE